MAKDKKVQELPGYIRDKDTNAIINTNSGAIKARRAQMNLAKSQAEQIMTMEKELAELKKAIKKLSK
tara:strand:+ start:10558 stop:10758 length:201 start_codon:yes stop_codon:yes gene_type:complete